MAYSRVENVERTISVDKMTDIMLQDKQPGVVHGVTTICVANPEPKPRGWLSALRLNPLKSRDAPQSRWRPLSMTAPILASIAALSLLIAAAIETLAQRSHIQGGLALSKSHDDIPYWSMIAYLYGPNICAVLYSLVWSWVDLDVKRMQPWFELSKPGGATAQDSLFLDYPYDFVAFVPLKAARRRHWQVFLSGTTMMVVFWLITPLQSAILGTGVVSHTEEINIVARSKLLPVTEQAAILNPKVLSAGYSVAWLNQTLPPFTTSDYAILPFYVDDDPAPTKTDTNWTTTTTKLSTELECWPAQIEKANLKAVGWYNFTNGDGCNMTFAMPLTSNYTMLYIGYLSSAYSDYFLAGSQCPPSKNVEHQFLAIWGKAKPPKEDFNVTAVFDFDVTAMFCQPHYFKQQVLANVGASGLKPENGSTTALSPRETLSADEFNSTAFEFLLGNGIDASPIPRDVPFNNVIEQHPRLSEAGLNRPVSNMVGFAMAGRDLPTKEYGHEKVLAEAYGSAHQYLFSVAVSMMLENETSFTNHTALSTFPLTGILVSRPFSAAVEGLLLLVAIFTLTLLWMSRTSPCYLASNPSSISRLVEIFKNSPTLLSSFRSLDSANDKSLTQCFRNDKFRLQYHGKSDETELSIERIDGTTFDVMEPQRLPQRDYYEPIRPVPLRRDIGFAFITVLVAAVTVLSYLKRAQDVQNGLSRPTDNFEVLQILENYLPTMFATLIEPFWVLLNRLLCVLQPFKDLWAGKTKSANSIGATYTSVPPQLVFFRALKSRHFILSLVCVIALLSNVLAVGLGALFNEKPVVVTHPEIFKPVIEAKFNNESVFSFASYILQRVTSDVVYKDHMYIAMANISNGTALPAWVAPKYFFQPFELAGAGDLNKADTYRVSTRGFGVNANCSYVPAMKVPIDSDIGNRTTGAPCTDLVGAAAATMRQSHLTRPRGQSAIEYSNTWSSESGYQPCDKPLTLGWGRTPLAENMNASIDASFAVCRPIFQTAMFNVTIDASGNVLSYDRTSEFGTSLGYPSSELHTDFMFIHSNHQLNQNGAQWHNDTLSRDWISYLVMISRHSRSALDPNLPLPTAKETIPFIEDAYRRLFVILLSLNLHLFEQSDLSDRVVATRFTNDTRIFLEGPAFIVTMAVLGLNLLAAMLFYMRAVVFVLPRMPTTIGSILAYVASSRVVTAQHQRSLQAKPDGTYSFGRYVGRDGEVHLGIELDPHVVPVDRSFLQEGKHYFDRVPLVRLLKRKRRPVHDKNWL